MIVFDASTIVSAALKIDSIPERALLHAEEADVFALSIAVDQEIAAALSRPKFARAIPLERRVRILEYPPQYGNLVRSDRSKSRTAATQRDDKYLELALASGAETIVGGDDDLLVLHPWRGVRIMSPAGHLAQS